MSSTLVLAAPRTRGAHRKPFPLTTAVIYTGTTLACAALAAAAALALAAPAPACHTVPGHVGWPNSHCRLSWQRWKQP